MPNNTDFAANPAQFIVTKAILIPGGINAGAGRFNLADNGNASCLLQATNSPRDLRGYYAKPLPNANNDFALPTTSDYMFTDLLNGCQFMAYGADRQHVTVEHNNFITTPANYAARYLTVHGAGHAYFFGMRPVTDYNALQGLCIIGTYDRQNGWRFWVRQRVDLARGVLAGPH